ncbi:NUDIX domain-containing protein [Candidatus Saccharibacteria bacterium]|nr:NUDIX domain-containing protein [Candidatus Saccharibacteria bacterium]
MTEHFDVVDENDLPTGAITTKEEAHNNAIPHRVVAVLVFTPAGKLIIQEHRSFNRLLDHSVGGHVSAGESYAEAASREVREELDLTVELKEVALSVPAFGKDPRPQFSNIIHFYGVYKTEIPGDWKFVENDEVDSIIEMTIDEVVDDMNNNPEKYLNGFFATLDAYLKSISSQKRIKAFGQDWSEL